MSGYESGFRKRLPIRGIVLGGRLIDRKIRRRWGNYLFQCGLSTLALMLILLVEDVVLRAAIVVAIASTAFVVFVIPHSVASNPQRVIGGHVVAVIIGSAFSAALLIPQIGELTADSRLILDAIAAVSVGTSIFFMVITNTEHPPAAGTTLGLVVGGWTFSAVVFILTGAVILSIVHVLLKSRLTNLL